MMMNPKFLEELTSRNLDDGRFVMMMSPPNEEAKLSSRRWVAEIAVSSKI